MSSLHISQGTFRLSGTRTLSLPELTLRAGEAGRLWARMAAENPRWPALWQAN